MLVLIITSVFVPIFLCFAFTLETEEEKVWLVCFMMVAYALFAVVAYDQVAHENLGYPEEEKYLRPGTYEVIGKESYDPTIVTLKMPQSGKTNGELRIYKLSREPKSQFVRVNWEQGKGLSWENFPPAPVPSTSSGQAPTDSK